MVGDTGKMGREELRRKEEGKGQKGKQRGKQGRKGQVEDKLQEAGKKERRG